MKIVAKENKNWGLTKIISWATIIKHFDLTQFKEQFNQVKKPVDNAYGLW